MLAYLGEVGKISFMHNVAFLFTNIHYLLQVKYLGEDGANVPICGAAAICSPWDLLVSMPFVF